MIADIHTGYGVRDGELLFIAEVERGLACGCVCASCGKKLVAKKGKKRRPHFAHFEVTNCEGAAESVLHLLAKELIAELDAIQVPPCTFVGKRKTKAGYLVRHKAPVSEGGKVQINNVRIEEKEGSFVPDIIIEYAPNKLLIVEIAVTHKVERAKLRRIRRRNLPAIEIRLDTSDSFLPRESLKIKLQRHLASKMWLFHPAQRKAERAFYSKLRQRQRYERRPLAPIPIAPSWTTTPFRTTTPFQGAQRRVSRLPVVPSLQSECDRTQEEFNKKHGRYPTMAECLRYWPHLWGKRRA